MSCEKQLTGAVESASSDASNSSPLRREVAEWLRRRAPDLADLYEGALKILSEPSFPGKLRFVAHAIREIVNRLPDALGAPAAAHIQYHNSCDRLEQDWRAHGLPIDGTIPCTPEADPEIRLPRSVFLKVSALLRAHSDARSDNEQRSDRMFELIDPEVRERSAVLRREWKAIGTWAVGKAHVPIIRLEESNESAVPSESLELTEEDVVGWFQRLETALGALLREFFATTDELDKILEEANS